MRKILNKITLILLVLICAGSIVIPAYADTDGTELQVLEPQKLEIQLGQSWSGVEFTLKTDAGMYPNTIAVDETGVLELEIGGSKNYVISCLQSSIDIPDPDNSTPATLMTLTREKQNDTTATNNETEKFEQIPTVQIIFLAVGIILAIGVLIFIHIASKRQDSEEEEEDEEDDI